MRSTEKLSPKRSARSLSTPRQKAVLHALGSMDQDLESQQKGSASLQHEGDAAAGGAKGDTGGTADGGSHGIQKMFDVFGTSTKWTFDTAHNEKVLFYDHDSLVTYKSILLIGQSVFVQKPVLFTLVYCLTLGTLAAAAMFFVPKASMLDTRKFEQFGNFLKYFITFMLGIYVQQAFKRWWFTVTTFEKFLIAIRQMTFMLHTIRCDQRFRKAVENYCVASGYILNVEVHHAQAVHAKDHLDVDHILEWLVSQRLVTQDESEQLCECLNHGSVLSTTRAIWSWIGEMLTQPMTEEGGAVPVPMMVRILALCQSCIQEIENLKMNITMQTPFMYAHLLSFLVHLNNTLLSLACGLSAGSALNEINRRHDQMEGVRDTSRDTNEVRGELYRAIQIISMQLVYLLTPMLYVAFLHIAHQLCYPFGDEVYHLPTETFIARLHHELCQMDRNRKYYRGKYLRHKKGAPISRKKEKENDEEEEDDGGD